MKTRLSVKDHVIYMARDVLGPPMAKLGFRRRGRVFWRDRPEVCHVATLALSQWGTRDEGTLDVHLGVFWHRVEKMLENPSSGKMPPPDYRCTFRISLGRTMPRNPVLYWTPVQTTDYEFLGRRILNLLRKYGLPWFEYRSNIRKTLQRYRYRHTDVFGVKSRQELVSFPATTAFKVLLGKRSQAIADLQKYADIGLPDEAVKLAGQLKLPASRLKLALGRKVAEEK